MIQVFDSGEQFADRYTVIIGDDAYGMSHDADQPNGYNQCVEARYAYGKPIVLGELPKGTLIAIIQRLTQCE